MRECARLAHAEREATKAFIECDNATRESTSDLLAYRRVVRKAESAYRDHWTREKLARHIVRKLVTPSKPTSSAAMKGGVDCGRGIALRTSAGGANLSPVSYALLNESPAAVGALQRSPAARRSREC